MQKTEIWDILFPASVYIPNIDNEMHFNFRSFPTCQNIFKVYKPVLMEQKTETYGAMFGYGIEQPKEQARCCRVFLDWQSNDQTNNRV